MALRNIHAFWVLSVLLLAGAAQANSLGSVSVQYTGDSAHRFGTLSSNLPPGSSTSSIFYVGRSDLNVVNPAAASGIGKFIEPAFNAYCIESAVPIYDKQFVTYDIYNLAEAPSLLASGNAAQKAGDLSRLFSLYENQVNNPTGLASSYSLDDRAAAFAADVWEIVNETTMQDGFYTYGLSSGVFRVRPSGFAGANTSWRVLANSWLSGLSDGDPNSALYALVNRDTQDFVVAISVRAVPEPITMLGAMLGLVGAGLYARKRAHAGL